MKRRWEAMVAFASRREDGTGLAVFRVLLALAMGYSLFSIGFAGLVEALWVHRDFGGMQQVYSNWLLEALGGNTPRVIGAVYATAIMATVTLGLGIYGRLSAFVLLQSYFALYQSNGLATGGYDALFSNGLWLLVLGDGTATLSIDCRRRTGAFVSGREVAAWPRVALIWQLVMVYGFTGIQKMSAPWTPGGGYTALYYVMHDPTFMRFDGSFVSAVLPISQIGTAVAWHWEHAAFLLPLVYWFRATKERPGRIRALFNRVDLRIWWAAIGVTMHLGILVMLDVGPFSLVSLSYYAALFTPLEVRGALARLVPAGLSAAADK